MRKIKLLSLVLAVVFCMTLCLAACDDGTVPEHDHVWNNGEVTTAPTCHSEGVKTYKCTVEGCEQTKTSAIGMTEHSWDEGETTRTPKCNDAGEKTFHCTNEGCTATKTEPIGKTEHHWNGGFVTKASDFTTAGVKTYTCQDCSTPRTESIEAHADYSEQFWTAEASKTDWSYGTATEYDAASAPTFVAATAGENVWTAEGVELRKDGVKIGANKIAVIVYEFVEDLPELCKAMFNIGFKGGNVKAFLVVSDEEHIDLNEDSKAEWTYATEKEDAVDAEKGSKVYLVLQNDGTAEVTGTLSFTIYAPCLHIWNQGEVKTQPKCYAKGVKTFSCAACEETYTEEIDMLPHKWDDGKVTTDPTEEQDGVKTFTCQNEGCTETKTESIPKLSPETEIANYYNDFENSEQRGWLYGYTDDYNFQTDEFSFKTLTKNGEEWSGASGIIIKKDWILSEAKGESENNAVIGYKVPAGQTELSLNIDFTCVEASIKDGTSETHLTVRILVVGASGTKSHEYFDKGVGTWNVNHKVQVEQNDFVYVILFRETNAWAQGRLQIVITGKHRQSSNTFAGANFADDFEATLAGISEHWSVGAVDYHFAKPETFDFTAFTTKNSDEDALHTADPWREVKGNWMAIAEMTGLAYTFDESYNVTFHFNLTSSEGTFSVRWALKDKSGNIKTNNGSASWGGSGTSVNVSEDLTVEEGDVLYILVQKESDHNQCNFTFTISPKQ